MIRSGGDKPLPYDAIWTYCSVFCILQQVLLFNIKLCVRNQPSQILSRVMSLRVAAPHMVMVDLSSPTILSM